MSVCCECCVLSGRGLCDELITRPEESYRLWCVVVCDQETSRTRKLWPVLRRSVTGKEKTFKTNWLLYLPPALPFCISAPYPHNTFIYFIRYLRAKKQQFPMQHWQFDPFNVNSICFLWRRKWNFVSLWNTPQPCHDSRCQPPASHLCSPGSIPDKYVQDLWCTKWHWDRLLSEHFDPVLLTALTTMSHTYLHINDLLLTRDKPSNRRDALPGN